MRKISDKIQAALAKVLVRMDTQVSIAKMIKGTANRYGEQKNLTFDTPITFYGIVASQTAESQLNGDGWMKDLELISVTTSTQELQRVGLMTSANPAQNLFTEGDRLIYGGFNYEIRDYHGDNPIDGVSTTVTIVARRGDK